MKKFFQKYKKIFATGGIAACLASLMAVMSFAADPAAADDATTITTGITTLFNQVTANWSFTNLVTFIGIGLGTCAVIALGYFGLRKVLGMIQTALKKGRIKV